MNPPVMQSVVNGENLAKSLESKMSTPSANGLIPAAARDVLANDELLSLICSRLEEDSDGRKSLLSFALASRMFNDPSLKALWRRMDSCVPILNILPQLKEHGSVCYYNGDLASSNFNVYANYIRVLHIPDGEGLGPSLSPQVWARLGKQLDGKALLPNLQEIHIEGLGSNSLALLPLLLSSSVTTMRLGPKSLSLPHIQGSVFASLPTDTPNLKRLIMEHSHHDFELNPHVLDVVATMSRVQTLELRLPGTTIDPDFIIKLGRRFLHLENLVLDIRGPLDPALPAMANIGSKPLFPSLNSVHLTLRNERSYLATKDGFLVSPIFPKMLLTQLTSVTVGIPVSSWSASSYCEMMGILSSAPRLRLLRLTRHGYPDRSAMLLFPDSVTVAVKIRSLEELVVDVKQIFASATSTTISLEEILTARASLQATSVADVPTATLRTLILPAQSPEPSSIRDLACVARRRPGVALAKLSLTIDSSRTPFDDKFVAQCVFSSPQSAHNSAFQSSHSSTLRQLEICDRRPTTKAFALMEYSRIARFLDATFPNLESVKPYYDSLGEGGWNEEDWGFIEHLRQSFKSCRLSG